MKQEQKVVWNNVFVWTVLVVVTFTAVVLAEKNVPSSRYMGGPAELVKAPNGAIVNKEVLEELPKTAWTSGPEIENPVEGVYVLGGYLISACIVVEAEDGLIVFDTGDTKKDGEKLLKAIRTFSDKPVKVIVYGHTHYPFGAKILAEITAFAQSFDGFNIMRIQPEGKEIKRMIIGAVKQANILPANIDYINAHGTGTEVNDGTEVSIIDDIFGDQILVNSTKSLIGHTLGASGAIEAAVAVLSILNKTTHVCKNLEEPINGLNFVRRVDQYPIRRVLSQSFAFGGHNAALIFEEFRQ